MSLSMNGVEFRIPTSIDNLPNELIDEIIYSLETEDIISLSLTNRRFNELGMRIVLRAAFPNLAIGLGFGPGSLSFSSLRYLRLAFYHKGMPPNLNALFSGGVETHAQMSEIHRYLQTLQYMPYLSLDTVEWRRQLLDDPASFVFVDICAELRRAQGPYLNLGTIPTPSSPSDNYRNGLMQNVLTNLNSFSCKNYLTCPVLREWAAASLNQSPLVSLSLHGSAASSIFPLLTLPHLQVLEMLGVSVSARDLIIFLNRHPLLKTLLIHCKPGQDANATPYPPLKTLPSLNDLSICSPAWASLIVSPGIFPAMTTFSISTPSNQIQDVVKYHDLLRVASQYKNICNLTFPLALLNTTPAWLQVPGPRAETAMQNVRTFYSLDECKSASTLPNLVAAIALFPSVQIVTLNVAVGLLRKEEEEQALVDDLVDRCSNLLFVNPRFFGSPGYNVRTNEDGVRRAVLRKTFEWCVVS
ncbi:hypothetical protein BDZ89DRAFT_1062271 [Hymenopellis radicata]|nr:hypothetical protein BDZ89DRAFT_1062271 [Hymenopellis radicata]